MALREELKQLKKNTKQDARQLYEKAKEHPLIYLIFIFTVIVIISLLIVLPYLQVNYHGINNAIEMATLENQYRVTLAQIIGGGAVLVGLYFAWGNLITAREGQITDRFTRAVDQLGSEKLEIRLGGIYALERIANESDKDCLPIMKILTAYIRANSDANKETLKLGEIQEDIQAILTIIGKQKYSFNLEEFTPNLRGTRLCGADLKGAHLERAKLMRAHLEGAHLEGARLEEAYLTSEARLEKAHLEEAHLEKAHLSFAYLERAYLKGAYLEGAKLQGACLRGTNLNKANLKGANLENANLTKANLEGANLEGADFHFANLKDADIRGAHLEKAKNLKIEQLLKVATLYEVGLDDELCRSLEEKYPNEYRFLNRNPDIRPHMVEDQ